MNAFFSPLRIVFERDTASIGKEGIGGLSFPKMIFTATSMEIVCLPFLIVWFGYYAVAFSQANPPS